ncbi:MAG TPA: hypothetical protein PL182_04635, partial [Pseudobdellovibrionaceae bacterium]|nr:hypothetical protein [Pseudobdellovibrionaceae bacterium]
MRRAKWITGLLLVPAFAFSQTEKLSIDKLEKGLKVTNAFDVDPLKGPARKGGLTELKWRESRGDWALCSGLAAKLQPASKDIEPWIVRTRLNCGLKEFEKSKK